MSAGFTCRICGQYLSSSSERAIERHADSVKHKKAAKAREIEDARLFGAAEVSK
jgi:hypothetical protein